MMIVANIIIIAGLVFMLFGVVGLFRFKEFYPRILVSAKIDTVGAITLIIGLMIKHGWSFFTLKLLVIMVLLLVLNPLSGHIIARSAYASDSKMSDEYDDGYGGV
ncbi:MAG: monovalent cation/H(+) antiporter subunit G [Oscillospiraceae bacterium]|nr:monovalent cation/H(+) antiporter subunit G [Oscillospiraceae bacterium]